MANVVVHIEGEQETKQKIGMFQMERKQKARKVIRKHTNKVRKSAKAKVPVSPSDRVKSAGQPGDLKKSIRAKYYFEGLGSMVLPAKPKGSHRHLVEYGTNVRFTKSGQNRGKNTPQSFMEPAKRENESAYNSAMKTIFEKEEVRI